MIYCQYAKLFGMGISLILCGCVHPCETDGVSCEMYDTVAESFLMMAREDVSDGKSAWNQGSGVAVVGEDGRHFIYTAKHVLFDKENGGALPTRLYATRMTGESVEIDFSDVEVPESNHDAVRIVIPQPICPELHLANHPPRYGERLYFFGDAGGAGVMCAEAGTVVAIGPLEFEHTADIIRGMSGGPIVDADCRLVGLCQKGRKLTARQNGVELPNDSRYLKTRRFGAVLHGVKWRRRAIFALQHPDVVSIADLTSFSIPR